MASSATAFEVVLPHQTLPEQPFVYNHHFTTTRLLHHGKMSNKRQVEAKLEKTSQKGLVWYVAKTWLLCECDFVSSGEGYSIALSQVLILCFQAAKYINNYNNISPNRQLELSSRKTCKDARCTLKPDWCCLLTAGWLSKEYDICLQKSAKAKPCIESFDLNDGQMTKIWRSLRCCRIWSAVEVQFSNWF